MSRIDLRHSFVNALLYALHSRRVLVALSALGVGVLVLAVPELAPVQSEILTLVVALALGLIGGYTVEDAARIGRERASLGDLDDLRDLIKDVVNEVIDATDPPAQP